MPPVDIAVLIRALSDANSYYIDVKRCREAQLALGLFASELEVERARNAVKRIEQLVKPHLDQATFDGLWRRVAATKRNRTPVAIGEWRDASGRAPVACRWGRGEPRALPEQAQESGGVVKDF